jgi:hypothetical protein
MSLQEDAERGARAQRLLSDPMISDAFATVERAIHDRWAESPLRDFEGQHELRLMLNLLRDVKAVFEVAVSDGKAAVEELNRKNRKTISPRQWKGIA